MCVGGEKRDCIYNRIYHTSTGIKFVGVLMAMDNGDNDNENGHVGDTFKGGSVKRFILVDRAEYIEPP